MSRLDFKFHLITIFSVIFLLLIYPAMKYAPVSVFYENSYVENFQLIVLLVTFIFCVRAKTDKNFFNSLALVCIILFLREVNCGRTIFFPVNGVENAFWAWKDIPYGFLAEPIYGVFMGISALYFIFSKSYLVLWNYFLHAKLSVYNWIFLFIGIIFGTMGEKLGNFALEEMTETIFYLSFMALIYLQSRNEKYIETTKRYIKNENQL
ncbi:MAG: hypothetical protein LUE64_05070 [Candidatus Gastranaerophilales bacterium]|nr:hypothetical protein [Candidatus Gastranaerophilales bacterium]